MLVALLAVAGIVSPSAAQDPDPTSESSFPADVTTKFDEVLQFLGELHVPGTVLGVGRGQDRYLGVDGTAGLDDPAPVQADSKFRIGSVTKTFTATAVLQLVDECRLRLDDTIERWQPHVPDSASITVRELLNHTSGIPDFADNPEFSQIIGDDPLHEFPPQALVDYSVPLARPFAPGAEWMYSNTNYIILGLIVEELTGRPLEAVIRERIFEPLHLDATSFPTTPAIPDPATSGALIEVDSQANVLSEQPFDLSPSVYWAAGAIISTAPDLEVWARALVEGTLLSPETQRARLTMVPMLGPETPPGGITFDPLPDTIGPTLEGRYGLGIFAMGGFIGHNGDIPGYEAVMMYEPDSRTTIVETQNARLTEAEQGVAPPGVDLDLPTGSVSTIAAILGQDPPLPPNPDGPTTPPCAQPPPPPPPPPPTTPSRPDRPPPSPPADAVVGRPTFTA
jgi:D-alanyl-D-alanine carboxypeptidase